MYKNHQLILLQPSGCQDSREKKKNHFSSEQRTRSVKVAFETPVCYTILLVLHNITQFDNLSLFQSAQLISHLKFLFLETPLFYNQGKKYVKYSLLR